eukprot:m51a1_g5575 hypothetical protein (670) ;mRNA; r:614912-617111
MIEGPTEFVLRQRRGAMLFAAYAVLSCLLAYHVLSVEQTAIQACRRGFWTDSALRAMRSPAAPARVDTGVARVVLVVVDGLRLDAARRAAWFPDAEDAAELEARSEVPSLSTPSRAALFTGAPPDISGIVGNKGAGGPLVGDTLFGRVAAAGLRSSFIVEDPVEVSLASDIDPVDARALLVQRQPSEDFDATAFWRVDELKGDYALRALNASSASALVYVSLTSPDNVGHLRSAVSRDYADAVANASRVVRRIAGALDGSTALVLVSDHGHGNPGGHGGTEPSVVRVPLYVYRRGSGLSRAPRTGCPYRLSDVAPTVAALLGLEPPRQSEGVAVPEALGLVPGAALRPVARAHWEHMKQYAQRFAAATEGFASQGDRRAATQEDAPQAQGTANDSEAAAWYVGATRDAALAVGGCRAKSLARHHKRNGLSTAAFCLVFCAVPFALMQRATACDPLSALTFVCRRTRVSPTRRPNVVALLLSLAAWALVLGLSWSIVLVAERAVVHPWGEWSISMTMVATDSELPMHFGLVLSTGLLTSMAVYLFVYVALARRRARRLIYLMRHYSAAWACCVLVLSVCAASASYFLVPGWLEAPFLDAGDWVERFRSLVGLCIALAAAVVPVGAVLVWPSEPIPWLADMYRRKAASAGDIEAASGSYSIVMQQFSDRDS